MREKTKEDSTKMQRNLTIKNIKNITTIYRGYHKIVQKRFLATVQDVFPHKTDFPSRHIGPRKTEVVAMLDLLGFKVSVVTRLGIKVSLIVIC